MTPDFEKLVTILYRLVKEHEQLIDSEFGTGKPDPLFDEHWPALAQAYEALNDIGICDHGNSIPDPECGCGT